MSEVSQGFLNRLTAKRAEVPAAEAMLTRARVSCLTPP